MTTEYRLAFGSGINLDTANHLRSRIATIIEKPDFGALTIMFSSEGGGTDQSLALFNFLQALPIPVHMHAMGHVGSVAVPLFLAGATRTASENSRFFFHEYDWGFGERQTLDRIDEATQRLRSDIELARTILKARSKVTADLLGTLDGTNRPAIIKPQDAKKLGIVDDVRELPKTGAQGMAIAVWT
jgi:ATP-dependent protease ClpP protease subunit